MPECLRRPPGLGPEGPTANISPPPVSATAMQSSPPTRAPIRRCAGRSTAGRPHETRCGARANRCSANRHSRGPRALAAPDRLGAADRTARFDQRHRSRLSNRDRALRPQSMLCSAGEHRSRRPRLSRPPLPRRQRRHHPRRPRAGRTARTGPALGIWTMPGGVVEAGETLIEALSARSRKRPR